MRDGRVINRRVRMKCYKIIYILSSLKKKKKKKNEKIKMK